MSRLEDLYRTQHQSPWLDNLRRGWITSGELARWVGHGVRGITSNPTIFQKAMSTGTDYDAQFGELLAAGRAIEDSYWDLVTKDILDALAVLRPVYDDSDGLDGYVSVEVAPSLARDIEGTQDAARHLWDSIARPNLYVKIPATAEGVPAIRQMISEGRNINVTLIFSIDRYDEVIEAYISGLEAHDGDLSHISSVASFFVSRVDTEVDRRLDELGTPDALALKGKAAVANAKLAYQLFLERFSGPRWEALTARGARVQRPLWASTSTKNPDYPDTLYVDELIGPDTVNTLPEATIDAFEDHGTLARTIDRDVEGARATFRRLGEAGVDIDDVSRVLEDEGVASFAKSFEELIDTLATKSHTLASRVSDLGASAYVEPSIGDWVSPQALEARVGAPFDAQLLAHNPLNAVTGGIWRVTGSSSSVIVKVLTDGRHHDGPEWWAASRADRHWNSWRREVLAYRENVARLFAPDGVGAPELVALDERNDGNAVLWLEDVAGRTGTALTVDDLIHLAGALGRAQGRLTRDRLWDRPWMSSGFLRGYSASKPVDDTALADDAAWVHPRVEHHLGHLRSPLLELRVRWDTLVSFAEQCPQTFCHLDVWPANVVRRPDGRFALLDWAFCGTGALGEDIANLVPDSVFDLLVPAGSVEALAVGTEDAYLAGVRAGGWQGDERWVRLGIRSAAAKYHWMAERLVRDAGGPARVVYGGRTLPTDEVYAARAAALSVLCRWADEAFALAGELGVVRR